MLVSSIGRGRDWYLNNSQELSFNNGKYYELSNKDIKVNIPDYNLTNVDKLHISFEIINNDLVPDYDVSDNHVVSVYLIYDEEESESIYDYSGIRFVFVSDKEFEKRDFKPYYIDLIIKDTPSMIYKYYDALYYARFYYGESLKIKNAIEEASLININRNK